MQAGLAEVSLPLRDALRDLVPGGVYKDGFGVGLWLPAAAAFALEADPFASSELRVFLREEELDAFTFNAFPFGGFHDPGLKQRVFQPDWTEPERGFYTRAVAEFALSIAKSEGWSNATVPRHLSISTHTGGHRSAIEDLSIFRLSCARSLNAVAAGIARMGAASGIPVRLGLEPEPRSLAGNTRELVELWSALESVEDSADSHESLPTSQDATLLHGESLAVVGVCLDTCHAAVEFERPGHALERAVAVGGRQRPLAKLQFSSALALRSPGTDPDGVAALLALDEPVYLHQTTGRTASGALLAAGDLAELRELQNAGGEEWAAWLACEEWRCHFHVPVDLAGTDGLGTTRDYADELLTRTLSAPELWGAPELHVEIETYTWSLPSLQAMAKASASSAVIPGRIGAGKRTRTQITIAGIEAEYRHVIALLNTLGWIPA